MLTIRGTPQRLCDGLSRRDFLRVGSLGALGLSWPTLLRAAELPAGGSSFGRAKRCVLLFLTGGPSQHDTWDPKPDAPAEMPVAPADLTATLLHLLGVKPDLEVRDRTGRPLRACDGTPLRALIG